MVVSEGTGHGKVDELLERMGVARDVRLTVPHFVAIGHILQATQMVATVPEKMAQSMAEPFGLAYAPHPAKLPQVAINLFWHTKYHRDPGNQWLRGVLVEMFAEGE